MAVNEKEIHSSGKFIISIFFLMFLTLFSGIFIGIIFAPKSGKKSRQTIKYWLREFIEHGKFKIAEAKVFGSEIIDKSKEKVEHFSSKLLNDSSEE